jgi:hypothetical protein
MSKFFIFSMLALIGTTAVVESAMAQDFNHRDSRERRRADYRQGYGDGVDCTNLYIQVGESYCQEANRLGCGRIMGEIAANPHPLLRRIVENRLPPGERVSSRTVSLAEEARACEGDRHGSFDRDVERESNQWHEREERRQREREERQE